jgi:hypothetical protein
MPRYLIHVGPHKTGTTYLQLRFDAARERLRKAGVAYPGEWSSAEGEPSHRKLVVGLREAHVAQLRSQFEAIERTDPDYVLISAEGLNHLQQPALELLKTLIGGHPVTVLFYCRRWSELLPSRWQEEVKHGHDETFPEFLSIHAIDPFESSVLNFARRLDIYSNVFGRENIKVVSYSNLCDAGIDLAEHFFAAFLPQHRSLLDGLPELPIARPNQSWPPLKVEVIRALNAFNARSGMPVSSALRDWYMAHAGQFDLADLSAAIEANAATLPFSDASPAAQLLHDRVSATYGDLMVPPAQPGCLFAPAQAEIVFFRQRYLTDRSAREVLDKVYTAFRREFHSGPEPTAPAPTAPEPAAPAPSAGSDTGGAAAPR